MKPRMWSIRVDGGETTASVDEATAGPRLATFVCAHGAGGHMLVAGRRGSFVPCAEGIRAPPTTTCCSKSALRASAGCAVCPHEIHV